MVHSFQQVMAEPFGFQVPKIPPYTNWSHLPNEINISSQQVGLGFNKANKEITRNERQDTNHSDVFKITHSLPSK